MDFQFLKFIHVLLAIVAVGFNASYGLWLARAAKAPQATQSYVLRTIKFIDDRIANPAYGLLALTGLFMVFSAGIPFSRLWIALAIGLYLVLLFVGFGVSHRRCAIRSGSSRARARAVRNISALRRVGERPASSSGSSSSRSSSSW